MKELLYALVCVCFGLGSAAAHASEAEFDNGPALEGLSRIDVYFDVNVGEANVLLKRMDLIERTVTQLRQAELDVAAVVGFRSVASRFVTKGDDDYVIDEEREAKQKIREWVRSFVSQGIRIEQCSIAAREQGIDFADFLPEVAVIKNGFVSMAGYQAKGYAVIPMD